MVFDTRIPVTGRPVPAVFQLDSKIFDITRDLDPDLLDPEYLWIYEYGSKKSLIWIKNNQLIFILTQNIFK